GTWQRPQGEPRRAHVSIWRRRTREPLIDNPEESRHDFGRECGLEACPELGFALAHAAASTRASSRLRRSPSFVTRQLGRSTTDVATAVTGSPSPRRSKSSSTERANESVMRVPEVLTA